MIGSSFGNKVVTRDLYSSYLINDGVVNAIGNYSSGGLGNKIFALPDTRGVVAINVILVHLAAPGKFSLTGYGEGNTALANGLEYRAKGRNYEAAFPAIKTNVEVLDLMSEVTDIEFKGQEHSFKMRFDFSGIGDIILDFSRGDNIEIELKDNFSTRLLRQTFVCRGRRIR